MLFKDSQMFSKSIKTCIVMTKLTSCWVITSGEGEKEMEESGDINCVTDMNILKIDLKQGKILRFNNLNGCLGNGYPLFFMFKIFHD